MEAASHGAVIAGESLVYCMKFVNDVLMNLLAMFATESSLVILGL